MLPHAMLAAMLRFFYRQQTIKERAEQMHSISPFSCPKKPRKHCAIISRPQKSGKREEEQTVYVCVNIV